MCLECDRKERSIELVQQAQEVTRKTALRNGKPWSDRENAALLEDRPLKEIAIELGRTYNAAATQRNRLVGADEHKYTPAEDNFIVTDARPVKELARILNRTPKAIRQRRWQLKQLAKHNATP